MSVQKKTHKKPSLGFGFRKPPEERNDIITAENQISFADFFNSCYLDELPWFFNALKQEQKKEQPKAGFGLNKMKEEPAKPAGKKDDQPPKEPNAIDVAKTPEDLNNLLGNWFARQMYGYQKHTSLAVQVQFCGIKDDEDKNNPLLMIPVWLQAGNRNVGFEIRGIGAGYYYHPASLRLAEKNGFSLPNLPAILEDFQPGNFLSDINELLIPYTDLSLDTSFSLVLQPAKVLSTPKLSGNGSHILPPAGNTDATWHNMLDSGFIPPSYNASQLSVVDQAFSGASFQIGGNSGLHDEETLATITTLLAYSGKKVLLLGENNFNIQKVYDGLKENNFARFCLPLHKIATRKQLTEILRDAIDDNWEHQKTKPVDNQKIRKLLNGITKYEQAWKAPFGELGMSPGQLTQTLAERNAIPTLPIPIPDAGQITRDDIIKWKRVLVSYQQTKKRIGDVEKHPWCNSALTQTDEEFLKKVEGLFEKASTQIQNAKQLLRDICNFTGAEKPENITELLPFFRIIHFLLEAPPTDAEQLKLKWNPLPDFIEPGLKLIKEGQFKLKEIGMYFHTDIIQEDIEEVLEQLEPYKNKFTRYFNWRYQKTVERLINYGLNKNLDENEMFWHNLYKARDIRRLRTKLSEYEKDFKLYFADDWEGLKTNTNYIRKHLDWFVEYDKRSGQYPWLKTPKAIQFILGQKGKTEARLESIEPLMVQLQDTLVQIRTQLKLSEADELYHYSKYDLDTLNEKLAERLEELPQLSAWCSFRKLEESVAEPFIREFLDKAPKRRDIKLKDYPEVLEKLILEHVLQATRADRPVLDLVTPELLDRQLELLNEYIHRLQSNTGPMMKEHFREARQQAASKSGSTGAPADLLRHELQKHARRNSISKILQNTFEAVTDFAPVWSARKDQWENLKDILPNFDTIIHIDGTMPDTIPANAQLIQAKSAGKVNNLPSLDQQDHSVFKDLIRKQVSYSPHSIPAGSVVEGKLPWQIIDHILQNILDGETSDEQIAVIGTGKDFITRFWKQIAAYANSKREIRDIISTPNLLSDYVYALPDDEEVLPKIDQSLIDVCGKASAQKKGFGFQQTQAPKIDLKRIYHHTNEQIHAFSNEKGILNQIKTDLDICQTPEASKPGLFANVLQKAIPDNWEIIPLKTPGVAFIQHEDYSELKYVIWTEADDENISLWNLYSEITRHGYTPLFFSGLHHLSAAKNRADEIIRKIQEDVEQYKLLKKREQEERLLAEQKQDEEQENQEADAIKEPDLPDQQQTVLYADSIINQLTNPQQPAGELRFKKAGKQRKAPIVDVNELPKLKDYQLHQGVNMGSREDFLDATDKQIQKLLLDIVKSESPIYWRNLMRCFASYWQIQRLSQNVEAILFRGISALIESEKIFAKDGCLYNNPEFNFKVRNRASTLAYHRPNEIPPDECEMAIFMVLEKFHPLPLPRLFDAAAHLLGFTRTDRVLDEQFRKVLHRMAEQETVVEGKYGLQLKPSLYKSSVKMPEK